MIILLPAIHCLLILLPTLQHEEVDDPRIADVAVLFKLLADAMPHVRRSDIQRVQRDNFRSLIDKP